MEDERAWFIFREGDESEERNRASFPRWGKLRVISYHFTELILHITDLEMLPQPMGREISAYIRGSEVFVPDRQSGRG